MCRAIERDNGHSRLITTLLGDESPMQAFGESLEAVKGRLLDMSGGLGTATELTAGVDRDADARTVAEAAAWLQSSLTPAAGGID